MFRGHGDASFGPEYERETFFEKRIETMKANRVNSKGRGQPTSGRLESLSLLQAGPPSNSHGRWP